MKILPALGALLLSTLAAACGDSCGDIACLPAPPPLEVIVRDTLSVAKTIRRLEGVDSIDVDTTVVIVAATPASTVTLVTESNGQLTTADTLQRSDTLHTELDLARIPSGLFRIRATRGDREYLSDLRKIESVGGCCPYSIVGRFTYTLPSTPE